MPIRTGTRAAYAPPAAILEVVRGVRDRGLTAPFTNDVLIRAGISESLAPRVLKSLEDLELIDEKGMPTPQLEGLRRATSDDFKIRLEEVIRAVYAEVFQFTDPAKDDLRRVDDAFRAYEPAGQRARMVTLFMGLCAEAGIVTAAPRKPTPSNGKPRSSAPTASRKPDTHRPPSVGANARVRNNENGLIPSAITGLLGELPAEGDGWTKQRRDAFLRLFGSALDFIYPRQGEAPHGDDEEQ